MFGPTVALYILQYQFALLDLHRVREVCLVPRGITPGQDEMRTGEKFKAVVCKYCGKTVEYTKVRPLLAKRFLLNCQL